MNLAPLPLVLCAFLTPPAPQEESGPGTHVLNPPPLLSLAEIVLDQYSVQNVSAEDLFQLAASLVGRSYFLKERGGSDGKPVANLRLLGDTIVIYDSKTEVQRVKELLARLDAPREDPNSGWQASEYRPRFLSLGTAAGAIQSLVDKYHVLAERGLLVLEGRGPDVARALELLKRIDVPEKQVLLTCQLLEVGGAGQGPALAKELLDNLQKLLPQSQFSLKGMAMLKTSVGGGSPISMQIDSESRDYALSFTPVAFDESSGSLTIADCALIEHGGGTSRELFRTNTVLRGGEYTVLAATGTTPRLLVVRVTPQ